MLWRNRYRQRMVDAGEQSKIVAEALDSLKGAVVQDNPPLISGTADAATIALLNELKRLGMLDHNATLGSGGGGGGSGGIPLIGYVV